MRVRIKETRGNYSSWASSCRRGAALLRSKVIGRAALAGKMSDLLAQFDIADRAEQARRRGGERDEAILGGGGTIAADSLNPFDGPELQSSVTAVQVGRYVCSLMCVYVTYPHLQ